LCTRWSVPFIIILSSLGVFTALLAILLGLHGIRVQSSRIVNSFHHLTIDFSQDLAHLNSVSGKVLATHHILYSNLPTVVVTGVATSSRTVDTKLPAHHFSPA
tara:strand:- start:2945 stop:3253 length:309 start_codon:yes stop_codon:yes gene_type:complete